MRAFIHTVLVFHLSTKGRLSRYRVLKRVWALRPELIDIHFCHHQMNDAGQVTWSLRVCFFFSGMTVAQEKYWWMGRDHEMHGFHK